MIVYEIKRNRPSVSSIKQENTWLPIGAPINLRNIPMGRTAIGMGKYQYAQWLNEYVYTKFRKGTLATIARVPIKENEAPAVWFVVNEIQEVHYLVDIDQATKEPKAVGVRNPMYGNSISVFYPPSLLRVLEEQEVAAIDKLRNQTREGRNLEATVSDDGTAVVIDRSTGEILKTEKDI